MVVWVAACWGLAGGMCVEGLEMYAHIRRTPKWNWRTPIPQGLVPYLLSVTIRGGLSAVVVAAAAASGQVISPFTALGFGVAAPLVVEKLARAVPVTEAAPLPMEPAGEPSAAPLLPTSAEKTGATDAG
jgi:hypothetical protein